MVLKKTMSFDEFCRINRKPELLALYDNEKSLFMATEIGFSCGKKKPCVCTCPDCSYSWGDVMNKLNQRKPSTKNYFTNTDRLTYCPYCKGERVSHFYNMAAIYPEILPFYDYGSNPSPPEKLLPNSHSRINIICDKGCGFTKSIKCKDFMREYKKENRFRCPKCGDGINKGANEWHNIVRKFPLIAEEFDENRNNGLKATDIAPSDPGKYWFRCKKCLNHFDSYIRNRCYRGDGCPVCNERKQTSFVEQALYFYIKKCFSSTQNREYQKRVGFNIDILIPELDTAIEYSGEWHHRRLRNRLDDDKGKLELLTSYYRTISIQEYPVEFKHPNLETIVFPVYQGRAQYEILNQKILDVLKMLDKNKENYPNIDLDKHEIDILQQYIKTPCQGSFEELYPDYAKDWDTKRNGYLTPSMFLANNSSFKFWWICRNEKCGRSYRTLMRVKAGHKNENHCPYCSKVDFSKQDGVSLAECYPDILPYWHWRLNKNSPDNVTINSEQFCVFRIPDGRIVPVKIYNLTWTLSKYPNTNIEKYLEKVFKSSKNKLTYIGK